MAELEIDSPPSVVAGQQVIFAFLVPIPEVPAFLAWPHREIESATVTAKVAEFGKKPEDRTVDLPKGLFHAPRLSHCSDRPTPRSAEYYWWAGLTFMPKKRGNPNWGRPMLPASVLCTEFEMQAKHLHLEPEEYVASPRLRKWCEENKNQHYIPEWLLKAWNMSVNSDLSGAA